MKVYIVAINNPKYTILGVYSKLVKAEWKANQQDETNRPEIAEYIVDKNYKF